MLSETYYAATDSTTIRNQINRLYFDAVFSAADLDNWRLNTEKKRTGIFKVKFTPFHSAFLRLYFSTRPICTNEDNDALKNRIDKWISLCQGSIDNPTYSYDSLIDVGLKLFDEWSKKLYEQNILEFT